MKTIYFSSAITGTKAVSEDFQLKIVDHMKSLGFKVLSEHVALKDSKSLFAKLSENSGINIPERKGHEREIRETDIKWVEEADYFIAIVDGPSLGVGIEIEHALLRERIGLSPCKILCLVNELNFDKLSAMIKGISNKNFELSTYSDWESAMKSVKNFLI